jgi:hypothetical protein
LDLIDGCPLLTKPTGDHAKMDIMEKNDNAEKGILKMDIT